MIKCSECSRSLKGTSHEKPCQINCRLGYKVSNPSLTCPNCGSARSRFIIIKNECNTVLYAYECGSRYTFHTDPYTPYAGDVSEMCEYMSSIRKHEDTI